MSATYLSRFSSFLNDKTGKLTSSVLRQQHYESIALHSPDGVVICHERQFIWLNLRAYELMGINTAAEFRGKCLHDFIDPVNHDLVNGYIKQIYQGIYDPAWIGVKLVRGDNSTSDVRLHIVRLMLEDEPNMLQVVIRDLKDYKSTDEKLRLAARVFDSIREGIIVTDIQQRIIRVNNAFKHITGYSEAEIIGKTPAFLCSDWHDNDFYEALWQVVEHVGEWEGEVSSHRKNGETFPQWLHISAIYNECGEVSHYIQVFTDLSRAKRSEAELDHMAHHDGLTGLANRLLLIARIEHALEHIARKSSAGQLAILWIDLDRFRHINNTLGHNMGDELLKLAAQRLTECMQDCGWESTVARTGADEFSVFLENIPDSQYAIGVARKILTSFAKHVRLEAHDIVLSASIGISFYPEDGDSSETLLQKADAALTRVKEEGGGGYQCFTLGMSSSLHDILVLGNSLHKALENQEFVLYYQPQVDIQTRKIVGAEAVLRWQHPERGLLSPNKFIPYAEETGLIVGMSEWALQAACRQNKQWQTMGLPPIRIGVNLTARQIAEEHTIEKITAALHKSRLNPKWLKLEVTESLILANPEQAILNMRALKKLGVTLSIDDFGTGYSSFSYLKQLPVDELKIDREFIKDIPDSPYDCKITPAMIAIGHSLELNVVGEGVETMAQLEFLEQHNCNVIQGFLFSQPVPADAFAKLFKANFWQPV